MDFFKKNKPSILFLQMGGTIDKDYPKTKGQLISEGNLVVFKSPFLKDFCPSL